MTSKLKCPFCGEEIVGVPNLAQTRTIGFRCCNIQCKAFSHFMPVFLLQALIQAKQDLEIAVDALKRIKEPTAWGSLCQEQELATEALEQISLNRN